MKSNFEINGNEAIIKINKNIYSKEIVVQTTYVLLDKYYFLIDCEEEYWIVSMVPKEEGKISEKSVYRFFDELIESSSYLDQMKNTSEIRQMILERAILTQGVSNSDEE
jgi:His-Xaa-Ser system protein HxsD